MQPSLPMGRITCCILCLSISPVTHFLKIGKPQKHLILWTINSGTKLRCKGQGHWEQKCKTRFYPTVLTVALMLQCCVRRRRRL